ncbi:glucosidase II beta subunit-like-domain-containing protein [Kockovaella imperatae]|uniref:Glucosidase 2 subunit beta n=1 Tax=Kockovaella imperatae TaxID=4999 RepID=A0A1Y1UAF9_9TREE|nr:glucosidase II beta subunit-like-domain-containing protein [Kockovaella imperatae]ORX35023.1 glucosidase II beta subunit-like-domain-containing protein [Kockovaella imperatae]
MRASSILFVLSCIGAQVSADAIKHENGIRRGLEPALRSHYEPNSSGTFKCLDGSKTIPYSALDDDYCDCPDGSDEPGTSACEGVGDQLFWCENKGHVPGKVRRSRVNDGLCDPECCDGSDEYATGACPNQCEEIGRAHREKLEAENKTRRTGSKIRSTYVKFAQNERRRLEDLIKTKSSEVVAKEVEVENARLNLERMETNSREALERKKGTPLYAFTLSQRLALGRLRTKTARLESELKDLRNILDELSKNYNPNYSDMAVKAAVKGFEELSKAADVVEGDIEGDTEASVEVYEEIQDNELDELERKDLDGLLLMDDLDMDDDEGDEGLLYKLDEYIPDSIYEYWATIRDLTIDWMIKLGLIRKSSKPAAVPSNSAEAPHVSAAREKHRNLSNELSKWRNEISGAQQTLGDMASKFGPDGEWKKLDGTCIDKVAGDYTYELCFFGRASQKSNKDSSSNHLGTWSKWEQGETHGSFEYYSTQYYEHGAKCWNGPQRSVRVSLTCGTQNALLSISEPEKCEYYFTATTPALCWPLDTDAKVSVKAEL